MRCEGCEQQTVHVPALQGGARGDKCIACGYFTPRVSGLTKVPDLVAKRADLAPRALSERPDGAV